MRATIFCVLFGAALTAGFVPGAVHAQDVLKDPKQELREDIRKAPKVEPREGERCLVCNAPLGREGTVRIVRGRRVPLMNDDLMLDLLLRYPEYHFAKVQPKGALFTERAEKPEPQFGWMALGVAALVLLCSAGAAAHGAVRRGLDPRKWFFAGLSGNLLAGLLVRSKGSEQSELPPGLQKLPTTAAPRRCPACEAPNHPAAASCSSCGEALEPLYESEASKV